MYRYIDWLGACNNFNSKVRTEFSKSKVLGPSEMRCYVHEIVCIFGQTTCPRIIGQITTLMLCRCHDGAKFIKLFTAFLKSDEQFTIFLIFSIYHQEFIF